MTTSQIRIVNSLDELMSTRLEGDLNALCFPRVLNGDFSEIVSKFEIENNMNTLSTSELLSLELSPSGNEARKVIMDDYDYLTNYGSQPIINLIKNYERDDIIPEFPTDVYSYHVDRATVESSTILCTYYGASSYILPNEQGEQKIQIPEIREALRTLHDGPEEEFDQFLKDYYFDLHYRAKPNSSPINLGVGNIWRLAIDYPNSNVKPCIHKAPEELDGKTRLLLIC